MLWAGRCGSCPPRALGLCRVPTELLLAALPQKKRATASPRGSSLPLLCPRWPDGVGAGRQVPGDPTGVLGAVSLHLQLGSAPSRGSRAAGELPPAIHSVLVAGTELQFTINLLFELIVL